ncbi:hypothetical protein SNS2_1767 [Streptomyces netropsis]|uniref:Transcriptional regulator of aromatic amino acid metabolism n=1 Tax=Streptomyces syringium TaxID=76729 RepID=A0ABS4Y5F9_9ACTN|nr:hypothetical protein [Streptomyces syringium]MBP2403153.1 transcriptional regulator of aromatic amino acid metabolism [Streptomyces syringium]SPE52790.1 hypothetical protein SNS2_1767 [Streptomyces netropsis]
MPNSPHPNSSPFFAVSGGTLIAMARPATGPVFGRNTPRRRPGRLARLLNHLDLKRG